MTTAHLIDREGRPLGKGSDILDAVSDTVEVGAP